MFRHFIFTLSFFVLAIHCQSQTKEEILGKKIFGYYQNHQMDNLLDLLPPYTTFAHVVVAMHNGDSTSLKKEFPNQVAYDSIVRSSARVNLNHPYEMKSIDWSKCKYEKTEIHVASDTLRSGEILKMDGLRIYFHEGNTKYLLNVETTFRDNGEIYIGERVFIGGRSQTYGN